MIKQIGNLSLALAEFTWFESGYDLEILDRPEVYTTPPVTESNQTRPDEY